MSDFDNAANQIASYVKAVFGVDMGEYGPEDEADWDVAWTGLGKVAVYAAEHPDWNPDFHWSKWKELIP